jgi:hypothetical protein
MILKCITNRLLSMHSSFYKNFRCVTHYYVRNVSPLINMKKWNVLLYNAPPFTCIDGYFRFYDNAKTAFRGG